MLRLQARQRENNRGTAGARTLFAGHRRRVTELVRAALPATGGRLCILGAGNCNDVELEVLARACRTVQLVDVDGEALERAVDGCPAALRGRLVLRPGVDLTGVAGVLEALAGRAPADGEVARLVEVARAPAAPGEGRFDLVVSAAVLTQLVSAAVDALGSGHPRLDALALALREGHLRVLARLLRPGGRGLLVTDFVSSDTLPELAGAPEERLPGLMRQALAGRNFFTGANPVAIAAWLRADAAAGGPWREPSLSGPWRWRLTPGRAYLVAAVGFQVDAEASCAAVKLSAR